MDSYRNRYRSRDPSPDLFAHQTRGRVNFSSQDGFGNFQQPQYPESQPPRRSRSADSRPQYSRGSTDDNNSGFFSAVSRTSYRSGSGFSSSPSRAVSNRAHSDVGVSDAGADSFRFHQIPKYEAVVHDDTMLYSRNERRRYRDGSSEDFLVLNSKSPAPARPGQATYHEQDRQYYNFAKENLITFGGFDAQTASTGLSQEELLARKQREEAFNKRKEKKKTKSKNRIINFPSSLRGKSQSPQRSTYSQQNEPQNQSSIYHKMSNLAPFQSNGRGEDVFEVNDNVPNPNGYVGSRGSGKGIRGSMVRRHQRKSKKSNNFTMQVSTNSRPNSSDMDYDRGMNDGNVAHDELVKSPGNRSGAGKHTMYNTDHDYLLVQRDLDHSTPHAETTPRSRGSNPRPSYADFTPKSDYYAPRDLFSSKPYTKDNSPTSVMDAFGNSGGVRWNNNLTQEEFIITPQSTKLRPDSQLRNSSGKPKSILRSRYSSSNAAKAQNENMAMDHPFDENFRRQAEGANRGQGFDDNAFDPSAFDPDFMRNFVDQNGRDLSPIGTEPSNDTMTKFPDSYVQFIEAVAAVVIQTKVRQRLAKNKVQDMRNRRLAKSRVQEMQYRAHANRSTYRSSEADRVEDMRRAHTNTNAYQSTETTMTPMVRKSYALARQKVRQANQMKASKGRKDVALDFYALAAIQIQAAFRGWWVRDCLGVDNFCAVMIQKIYRGYRCRKEYLMDMNRIVTVQSTCRRWMAIDDAVTRIYCIVRIQAVMRGALVRKRMMGDSLEYYHAAATVIQTVWRSFWCEMTFLRAYEDILVVQSVVRGWLARKRFRALLQSKNNKFTQRRKPSTRFKSSRLPSSKARNNVGTYSNHTDYAKNNAILRSGKPEISKSQPSVAKKVNTSYSASRGSHSPWKAQNNAANSNKGIETTTATSTNARTKSWKKPNNDFEKNTLPTPDMKVTKSWQKAIDERKELPTSGIKTTETTSSNPKKTWKKPNANIERNTIPAPPVNSYAGKSVSASRSDIERRRQEKEQERQARKEEENRRLESQNAGLAELELARRKMAWKKEEKLRQEQQNQVTESPEDTQDSDYFDQVRKSNSATTQSSFTKTESSKVDAEKSEESNAIAGGKEKSIVEKRREALMTSNGNGPSKAKESVSAPKSGIKSAAKADTKEVSPTEVSRSGTVSTPKVNYAEVPERTLVTNSTYQKDMAKLRSDSEQKRIDYMHHIFNQAGLLSRVK